MSILSCLTPKSEVDYINDDATLFKTLQKMQARGYEAIPIISDSGKYVGTIKSGDILGFIMENFDLNLKDAADVPLKSVRRTRDNKAVNANSRTGKFLDALMEQNFVSVVDDEGTFIGIVTRRDGFKYMRERVNKVLTPEED